MSEHQSFNFRRQMVEERHELHFIASAQFPLTETSTFSMTGTSGSGTSSSKHRLTLAQGYVRQTSMSTFECKERKASSLREACSCFIVEVVYMKA